MYTIKCNNHPRLIIDAYQLTDKEKEKFDYIEFNDECSDTFIRYKGELIHLNDVMACEQGGLLSELGWHGYVGYSYFNGVVIKHCDDSDYVIVGYYYN